MNVQPSITWAFGVNIRKELGTSDSDFEETLEPFILLSRLFKSPYFRSGIVEEVKGVEKSEEKRRGKKRRYIFFGILKSSMLGRGLFVRVYTYSPCIYKLNAFRRVCIWRDERFQGGLDRDSSLS